MREAWSLATSLRHALMVGAVFAMVPVVIVLGATAAVGGISTDGEHLDWQAVAAMSGIATAAATVLAVSAVAFAARELDSRLAELRRQNEQDRVLRMPYLRVDIGFVEPRSPGFEPPATHIFTSEDFHLRNEGVDAPNVFAPLDDESSFRLVLWVTNLQTLPLGIAYDIRIEAAVGYGQPTETVRFAVDFTYVAPGQTTAIELARVRHDVPSIEAFVESVQYRDLFGRERLTDTHGASVMLYDSVEGVTNDRTVNLSRFPSPGSADDRAV